MRAIILAVTLTVAPAFAQDSPIVAAPPVAIAAGVTLIPGASYPGRGPDGNTLVFRTPQGLVVLDTGRHVQHSDAILAFAAQEHRPIVAIVNSHWHLDHTSGNGRIKAAFPQARIYATTSIDRALTGFLAENLRGTQQNLATLTGVDAEEAHIFIDTMADSAHLRPDVPVTQSGRLRIGGQMFDVHVTDHAVTDADIWLYDPSTQVAAIGDLVTVPAPYFETACSERWREALDQVWATPFRVAIPGHGAPMTREQFNVYRVAYGAFIDCVHSSAEASTCAAAWGQNIASLTAGDENLQRRALRLAQYYVGYLRQDGGNSHYCLKP